MSFKCAVPILIGSARLGHSVERVSAARAKASDIHYARLLRVSWHNAAVLGVFEPASALPALAVLLGDISAVHDAPPGVLVALCTRVRHKAVTLPYAADVAALDNHQRHDRMGCRCDRGPPLVGAVADRLPSCAPRWCVGVHWGLRAGIGIGLANRIPNQTGSFTCTGAQSSCVIGYPRSKPRLPVVTSVAN